MSGTEQSTDLATAERETPEATAVETYSGAEILIRALTDQGVEVIFGYPGGAVLPIYDALFAQNNIRHILVRQEGGAVHAAEGYLLNLIRKGFRVAVCEQLENPQEAKKRGAKSVVKRGVVRLVTPGTLTEDTLLHPRQSNFLASFVQVRNQS